MDENVLHSYCDIPCGKIELSGNIQDILEKELQREAQEEVGIKIKDVLYISPMKAANYKSFLWQTYLLVKRKR